MSSRPDIAAIRQRAEAAGIEASNTPIDDIIDMCDRVEALERALAGLVDWNRHRYPLRMGGGEFPPTLQELMNAAHAALEGE